jgi:hypothetical protein
MVSEAARTKQLPVFLGTVGYTDPNLLPSAKRQDSILQPLGGEQL